MTLMPFLSHVVSRVLDTKHAPGVPWIQTRGKPFDEPDTRYCRLRPSKSRNVCAMLPVGTKGLDILSFSTFPCVNRPQIQGLGDGIVVFLEALMEAPCTRSAVPCCDVVNR